VQDRTRFPRPQKGGKTQMTSTSSLLKAIDKLGYPSGHTSNIPGLIVDVIDKTTQHVLAMIAVLENNIIFLDHQKQRCSEVLSILEEMGGLTVRARNFVGNPQDAIKYQDRIKDTEELFKLAMQKLDKAVSESAHAGVNLLTGDSLTTQFDDKGQNILLSQGISLTTKDQGIRHPDFSNMISVQNSRIDVMNAIDMAVTLRNIVASDIVTLTMRRDFANDFLDSSKHGRELVADKPLGVEAPQLLMLQRQSYADIEPLAEGPQQITLDSFASKPEIEKG